MNTDVIVHVIMIIFSALFGFMPRATKPVRPPWAVRIFTVTSVILVSYGAVSLGRDLGWLKRGTTADQVFRFLAPGLLGMTLGLILALTLSGQLFRRQIERVDKT